VPNVPVGQTVTAAPPARRHHQTYPDPIRQSAASRRRACGAARRRQPDRGGAVLGSQWHRHRVREPPPRRRRPLGVAAWRSGPPRRVACAGRRPARLRRFRPSAPAGGPRPRATPAVADCWASLPGDLVRLRRRPLGVAAWRSGPPRRVACAGRRPARLRRFRPSAPAGGPRPRATPAVADRWASLPGDLVRLVASRVLAGDLLDYAASGRLHRLAVRCRLPSRPRRRRPALPPALLDDASRGPACAPATPTFAGTSASSTSTRGPWFAPTSRTSVTTAPSILSRQTNIKIRSLADPVSASVSFSAGAITVMLALHEVHRRVAFATTMDRQWNVSSWTYQSGFPPPFSFRGKLYITCYALYSPTLEILQIDPPVREGGGVGSSYVLHPPKLMATVPEGSLIRPIYLVECDSERSCCLATKISACRRLLFSSSPILSFKGVPR
jgi:hypothetical protein